MRRPRGIRHVMGICHPGTGMAMQRIAVRGQSLGAVRDVVDGIHGAKSGRSRASTPSATACFPFPSRLSPFGIHGRPKTQPTRLSPRGAAGEGFGRERGRGVISSSDTGSSSVAFRGGLVISALFLS